MFVDSKPAVYLAQVLFGLFVTNSALPMTSQIPGLPTDSLIKAKLGPENETRVRIHDATPPSPESLILQASIPYPVRDTAITLNFTYFGFQIPVVRALSTINDARRQVRSYLASYSEFEKRKDVFEYSTPCSPPATCICSVFVLAYPSLGLSWVQLDQILEGLTLFTSGGGIDRQLHCQALKFEVHISKTGKIGTGLLSCTLNRRRSATEVERRAEILNTGQELNSGLDLVPVLTNETSSDLSNASSLLSNSVVEFPLNTPGTKINLAFVWLGSPISSTLINEVLHGAFLKIAPFLIASADERVPNGVFLYWTAAGKTEVAIQIYGMVQISWSQVDSVVAGLYRFTNGIGTDHDQEHYKNLGFDIKDGNGVIIGYGNLLAVRVKGYDDNTATTTAATDEKRSPLPPPPPSSQPPPTPLDLHLHNTTHLTPPPSALTAHFILTFTYLGEPLPDDFVNACLQQARRRIQPAIRATPDRAIGPAGFEAHLGTVQVVIAAYEGAELTWWQLGEILSELDVYCTLPHKRLLVFEIEVEGWGRLGAGRLWWYEGPWSTGVGVGGDA